MANLPTDADDSPNYTADEHATHHNTLAAFHNLIDAKGDLIGGTGTDTAGKLAVGTNGHVLTADSAETTGMKWATPSGTSALLGITKYDPGSYTTKTSTSSVVNLDTTNLTCAFTVPASGKVLVHLRGLASSGNSNYYWVVRNASDTELGRSIVLSGSQTLAMMTVGVYLTGLTPGALTIRWAHVDAAGAGTVNYGDATGGIPAVIEVWAAP